MAKNAMIVAHPDDETLWAGGLILEKAHDSWFIACLCRRSDPDRAPKFTRVLQAYGAQGALGDLDDGPEQDPLSDEVLGQAVLELLPEGGYDLIVTHAPTGEYTRHRRHEETSRAVMKLWQAGSISTKELWLCAYDDDCGRRLPLAIEGAHRYEALPDSVRKEKFRLITEVYGFDPQSWEAKAVPQNEAFWRFRTADELLVWMEESGLGQNR